MGRLGFLGWVVVCILALLLMTGAGIAVEAAGLTWYAPWKANKQTEIIRNTNQYVASAQANMRDAWQRYLDPNATEGQKKAAIQDWCAAANTVDDKYVVPEEAKQAARQEQCWNGF